MQFSDLINVVQGLDDALRRRAAKAVNVSLTARNWLIGAWIVEFEQNGEDRARYGERLIAEIAQAASVNGLSVSNLRSCRQFYAMYPQIGQALSGQFGHELGIDTGLLTVAKRIHQSVTGEFGNGAGTPPAVGDRIHQTVSGESTDSSEILSEHPLSDPSFSVSIAASRCRRDTSVRAGRL